MEEQLYSFPMEEQFLLGKKHIGTKFLLEGGSEGLVARLRSGPAVLIHRQGEKTGNQWIDYAQNFPLPIEMHQMEGEELEIVKIEGSREIIRPEGATVVPYWTQPYKSLDAQLKQAGL